MNLLFDAGGGANFRFLNTVMTLSITLDQFRRDLPGNVFGNFFEKIKGLKHGR